MELEKINIKIKEYPPLIPIKTVIQDRLVGAKSYKTVIKRLKAKGIEILAFDMVNTRELFIAMTQQKSKPTSVTQRRSTTFKLR